MQKAKKKKAKATPVTREFLNGLAKRIYDGKSKTFLRLCRGTLENGPDPTDSNRKMHCGLGELYFAMTGRQPKADRVSEDDVVQLAVERSAFGTKSNALKEALVSTIEGIKDLPDNAKEQLLVLIEELAEDNGFKSYEELEFRELLDNIPTENDSVCGESECNTKAFKARSKRVAEQLRAAAKLLPATKR